MLSSDAAGKLVYVVKECNRKWFHLYKVSSKLDAKTKTVKEVKNSLPSPSLI